MVKSKPVKKVKAARFAFFMLGAFAGAGAVIAIQYFNIITVGSIS